MAEQSEKEKERTKLPGFMHELQSCSTLKGFQHFSLTARGREEVMLTVNDEPALSSGVSSGVVSLDSSYEESRRAPLPRNEQSLLLSTATQRRLSGFGFIKVGLPPASPCDTEIMQPAFGCTLFLIAAYQRYSCPYVWVRSGHERLVRINLSASSGGVNMRNKYDNPLKLRSTGHWLNSVVQPWDIMAEVIHLNMVPSPLNPFSIDFSYFEGLPGPELFLASGAMAFFLRKVLLTRHHSYDQAVAADLKRILQMHFSALCVYVSAPDSYDEPAKAERTRGTSGSMTSAPGDAQRTPTHSPKHSAQSVTWSGYARPAQAHQPSSVSRTVPPIQPSSRSTAAPGGVHSVGTAPPPPSALSMRAYQTGTTAPPPSAGGAPATAHQASTKTLPPIAHAMPAYQTNTAAQTRPASSVSATVYQANAAAPPPSSAHAMPTYQAGTVAPPPSAGSAAGSAYQAGIVAPPPSAGSIPRATFPQVSAAPPLSAGGVPAYHASATAPPPSSGSVPASAHQASVAPPPTSNLVGYQSSTPTSASSFSAPPAKVQAQPRPTSIEPIFGAKAGSSAAPSQAQLPPLQFAPPPAVTSPSPEKPPAYFGLPPSDDMLRSKQ